MEWAAERGAGDPTSPPGASRLEGTGDDTLPPAPAGAVPRSTPWLIPAVALGISLVTVPLVAAAAVALHATSWQDLVGFGLGAALLTVIVVLVPLQLRLARLAGTRTGHWWRQATRTAAVEAELSAEREELLHQALAASDRERRQLAADLHDGVIQLVSAVTLRTATLARGLRRDGGQSPERVAAAIDGLDRITVDLQAVTADLRGLMGSLAGDEVESQGLTGALSALLVPLAESGVQVEISVGELDCDARIRRLIHRVAQELVRNTARHAAAHRVVLSLSQEPAGVLFQMSDDGQGFDVALLGDRQRRGHMGLLLVRQRVEDAGGEFVLSSTPGHGTRVLMRLPLAA
ncbi:MAG: sensor histidine kinase [Candidatus Dormibacteria bacterium]